jgi:hypothetical protein
MDSRYARLIAEDLEVEVGEAAVIEQVLRASIPTLDHLSRVDLAREARISQRCLEEFRIEEPEIAHFYERQAA